MTRRPSAKDREVRHPRVVTSSPVSIRVRLTALYSIVLFGLATSAMVLAYFEATSRLDASPLGATWPLPVTLMDESGEEQLARSELIQLERDANDRAAEEFRRSFFLALGAMFVLSLAIGWVIAGQLLKPIEEINTVAQEIQASDLSRRIDLHGPNDELKRLADTFDEMLDRLEAAFTHQQRFIQEASHELRNPLAVMRSNLDVALADPDVDVDELRHTSEIVRRSAERMSAVVDDMVRSVRHEDRPVKRGPVDLGGLAQEEVDEFTVTAEKRGLQLEVIAPAGAVVTGDVQALRQVVANLLDNAVRLGPPGSSVTVVVDEAPGVVRLAVRDDGPGIAEEHHEKVFQRYWRGSGADGESRRSGLGLAIVRQIAEAHGGEVLLDSEAGGGSTFTVVLPAARP